VAKFSSNAGAGNEVQKLFLQHAGVLRGFVRALLANSNLVDDVLNSIFIVVIEKANEYESGTDFLAWTKAIARIEVKRACSAGARMPHSLSPETIDLLADEARLDVPQHREVQLLAECLDKLAPRSRRAIDLRYKSDLKPSEIARHMSVAQETVYVWLSRARASLRECLQRGLRREGVQS
jgi:RNA polymerase sigma-70 factor (ECF subfamily)